MNRVERAGRGIDFLTADRERRSPGEDEVQLLVPAGLRVGLNVRPDDLAARLVGRPRVHSESTDVECLAKGLPAEAAAGLRNGLDLGDVLAIERSAADGAQPREC